jgi:hypothetical protein
VTVVAYPDFPSNCYSALSPDKCKIPPLRDKVSHLSSQVLDFTFGTHSRADVATCMVCCLDHDLAVRIIYIRAHPVQSWALSRILRGCGPIPKITLCLLCRSALARILSGLLFGVRPFDIRTLLLSAFVLVAATTLAALIPAWRSAKMQPMSALRAE